MYDTFFLASDKLLETKSREAIWEGERHWSPARFFFQNLLILSMLLILVHLFTLLTPFFNYCTCQKHNCPVLRHQVTNKGKGRGSWLYGAWYWTRAHTNSDISPLPTLLHEWICYCWTLESGRQQSSLGSQVRNMPTFYEWCAWRFHSRSKIRPVSCLVLFLAGQETINSDIPQWGFVSEIFHSVDIKNWACKTATLFLIHCWKRGKGLM